MCQCRLNMNYIYSSTKKNTNTLRGLSGNFFLTFFNKNIKAIYSIGIFFFEGENFLSRFENLAGAFGSRFSRYSA